MSEQGNRPIDPWAPRARARASSRSEKASDVPALRAFLARILGWADERTVEHALRSLDLSVTHRAALVLLGDTDLVPIAHALHRRAVGADRPFVVCDRRRSTMRASVRVPMNHESGVAAVEAARGGSLCLRRAQLPRDFSPMVALVRDPATSVQLIVCGDWDSDGDPLLALPAPIRVPPLGDRASELPRIVDEYALDAIRDLSAGSTGFAPADHDWVIRHAAASLPEIEKGTRRLVAVRQAGSIARAAARLGMSHVALSQWLERHVRPVARVTADPRRRAGKEG